jgi:APA family basic amino acid/polyamine antiporter
MIVNYFGHLSMGCGTQGPMSTPRPEDTVVLPRHLGMWDTVALYVGIVLGSGIFVAPQAVAAASGGGFGGVAMWLVAGFVALCGAFCYAECGSRLPHPGGFYIFYREALGPSVAFVGGWAAFIVTYPASLAAIAHIFSAYLGDAVPALAPYPKACAVAAIALAGVLGIVGMRTGPVAQRILTAVKVGALLVLVGAAAFSGSGEAQVSAARANPIDLSLHIIVAALMQLLWTYDGWSNVGLFAGEVKDPNRALGRSVVVGTAILVVVYALVQLAVGMLLPVQVAASSDRVVADAVRAGLGDGIGRWVSVLVVISTFGAIAGSIFAGARIGFAMARDGLLPSVVGQTTMRWQTPGVATVVLTVACMAYAVAGGFGELLTMFTFSAWLFYALVAVCLLILRRRGVGGSECWRSPGGLLAPVVVIATAVAMTMGAFIDNPGWSSVGAAILLVGLVGYKVGQR